MIRRSLFVLLLVSAPTGAQQDTWHGPYQPPAVDPAVKQPLVEPPMVARDTPHVRLGSMLGMKLYDEAYAAALAARGKIPSSHHMPQELWVRKARAVVAQARKAPPNVRVLTIPVARTAPRIDGAVSDAEWEGSLSLPLVPEQNRGEVLLLAHGGKLYLGALARSDRTEDGFDQFRFWYHIGLSPYMENERVFLAGKGWTASLRDVRLPDPKSPILESPPQGTALKQFTDWNIFDKLESATRVLRFRQYEMALDLSLIGIAPGVPFPAFFEIEGDPERDSAGKFKARAMVGLTGTRQHPLWLQIGR